ncbi:MAG: hypothetical protein IT384_04945 [Deltaproteobacteria bacterium]|nr:hypothetical protein [Deltaproteobacteria bacterium]
MRPDGPLGTAGLSLQQGPPLSIPLSFFATACLGLSAAGVLVLWHGLDVLALRYLPSTLALVHVITLGFLAMVMIGALYQLIPVVAASALPRVRHAHLVHALLTLGATLLITGLHTGSRALSGLALGLLLPALLVFITAAGWALARSPVKSDSVRGFRASIAALGVVISLGVSLLLGRMGSIAAAQSASWLTGHAGLALLAWVGGLIAAVSWQVVPMFYLTAPLPRLARRLTLWLVAVSLVGGTASSIFAGPTVVLISLLPAAVAVAILQPLLVARALWRRKRQKVGESVRFWWASIALAPLALATAAGGVIDGEPRWSVLLGWLTLIGWAAMVVHGMLSRIVPFLVWFHFFSGSSAGRLSMRELLPEAVVRRGFIVHAATLLVGAVAIVVRSDLGARAAGLGLAATGASMLLLVATPVSRARRALR